MNYKTGNESQSLINCFDFTGLEEMDPSLSSNIKKKK